jgi:hypothetical protein
MPSIESFFKGALMDSRSDAFGLVDGVDNGIHYTRSKDPHGSKLRDNEDE